MTHSINKITTQISYAKKSLAKKNCTTYIWRHVSNENPMWSILGIHWRRTIVDTVVASMTRPVRIARWLGSSTWWNQILKIKKSQNYTMRYNDLLTVFHRQLFQMIIVQHVENDFATANCHVGIILRRNALPRFAGDKFRNVHREVRNLRSST